MKKSKRAQLSQKCRYCLRPFGFPLCAYGIKPKDNLTIRDFPICWNITDCPYEKELEKQKTKGEIT